MIEQQRIYRIKDVDSLLGFLREDLYWDLPEASIDDVSFEWTGLDLNLSEDVNKKLKGGLIRQLQPFATYQPWGIFVVEFATREVSIITLRQILRCFVAKRRGARPDLPAWQCENLLFICLYGKNGFTFAHFKGDKPYSAKLTTFSWHPGEPIRTVCEFNLQALVYNDTWTPETWVMEWQKAFDVEKVNKDFYKQIARFYYRLTGKEGQKRELVLPYVGDDTGSISIYEEFAVRLIGRSIFCWFLKHKVSEESNVPLIPPEALSLAAAQKTADFYHSMLEPLFFEVMNKRINKRKSLAIPRSEIIPFLNGGLFEQHPNDFYAGAANYGLKISDTWFIDFFSLLERYNFTITENSSIDVDVAVDPEMLGRIFENLLAEVVPETGETARKATGSYYTPRAIVDYMVEQSLKQYLLTKTTLAEEKINRLLGYGEDIEDFSPEEKLSTVTALKEIKVTDPACGSGAFPMGVLHRMLAMLEKVDPRLELWRAQYLKSLDGIVRQTVEKSISRENWAYIRKLMIIRDSVYGVDIQPIAVEIAKLRCFLSLVVDEIVLDKEENRGIEPLPNLEFKFVAANTLIGLPAAASQSAFGITDTVEKLKELRESYLRSFGAEKSHIEREFRTTQQKLFEESVKWALTDKQVRQLTDWDPFSYRSCGWFDPGWMFGITCGFDIAIGNPPWISNDNLGKTEKELYKKTYKVAVGRFDIANLFAEKAIGILNESGLLFLVMPEHVWLGEYYIPFRTYLAHNVSIVEILSSKEESFEQTANPSSIFLVRKVKPPSTEQTIRLGSFDIEKGPESFHVETNIIPRVVFDEFTHKLTKRLQGLGYFTLDQVAIVTDGIQTADLLKVIFTQQPRDEKLYYRALRSGKSIRFRYANVKWDGWWVLRPGYTRRYKRPGFSYDSPKRVKCFSAQEKIILRQTEPTIFATIDNNGYYFPNSIFQIALEKDNQENIRWLLGLLNSKFLRFFYSKLSQVEGTTKPQIYLNILKSMPVPVEIDLAIPQLVDEILALTRTEDYLSNPAKQAKVKELERQIDQKVYELYGLTPEEIAVVEGRA